jgi:iron complex transport system ATP-binding protein
LVGSPKALELINLSVDLDGKLALDDVSWSVEQGQHAALLGPNGCGKSTLLNALLTFAPITRGELRVLGETYGRSDWRELRKRVGLVSAEATGRVPPGDPVLKVVVSGAQATFGLWGEITDAQASEALEVLAQLNCASLSHRRFGTLSQGERQRVLIARALAARPELLILDEPCTNLDIVARDQFLHWLERSLQRSEPTTLLVTHHPEEIVTGIEHTLLLSRGRTISSGPTERVLTSQNLSAAYGVPLNVHYEPNKRRFDIRVAT